MILVIGATGFVGRHLTSALAGGGLDVRALVRDAGRARPVLPAGVELAPGDMRDPAALDAAMGGVRAVYIAVQTLTRAQGAGSGDYAEAELRGLAEVAAACRRSGVPRLVAVGLIGARADAPNAWVRARAEGEALLFASGLEVTVIRPGLVVGRGGVGFDGLVAAAGRRVAVVRGPGRQLWRPIALDDLIAYLVGVLDEPASYGRALDVGTDELASYDDLLDETAEVLGRRRPRKLHLPLAALRPVAGLLELAGGLPQGGLRAGLDHLGDDLVGDPGPIRQMLPRPLLAFREAADRALRAPGAGSARTPTAP
ncbi:MAG: SDR family oxidoreductase [Candidatus Limnocylindrales bacterium]